MNAKNIIRAFFIILLLNVLLTGVICALIYYDGIAVTAGLVAAIAALNGAVSIIIFLHLAKPYYVLITAIQSLLDMNRADINIFSKNTIVGLSHMLQQFNEKLHSLLKEKDVIVKELKESKQLLEKYSSNLEEMVEQRTEILKWLSITDPLTGLYNRRYFIEQIDAEFKRSKRYTRDLSLLMLDIDHFKRVNDDFGHQAGDIVLRKVSSIIVNQLRTSDLAFRYGGEEFMVILPETKPQDAINAAQRMKDEIMNTHHAFRNVTFSVTASIGIVSIKDTLAQIETVDDIIKIADDNLYKAKKSGRNTIIYE